jgi:energy-coupling factor transport system permease protein
VRPLPVALVTVPPLLVLVLAQNPLLLGATCALTVALLAVSPPPRKPYVLFALTAAVLVFVINPFASVQGLTTVWQGPQIPVLDTEITQEELLYGLGAAVRLAGSALAFTAFIRLAAGDRVLAAVARVAPRSALIAALATRLLPALEADASGLVLAARARGARLGGRRPSAELLGPLVGLSLERSLALAEAMEARGYGSGARTRLPAPAWTRKELALLAVGVATALVAVACLATGAGDYTYYPLAANPVTAAAVAASAAMLLLGAAATGVVRWLD